MRIYCLQSAFPVIKLGTLVIKQISKPLAAMLKRRAKQSPLFGRYVCKPPAQFYHWMDTKLKMRLMGLGNIKEVKPLNEELAIELGADLLGEVIIFSVAVGTLYFEYWRQNKNAQEKEDIQNNSLVELNHKITELAMQLERQDAQIRELTRLFHQPSITERISAVVGAKKTS
ncbi:putative OPA3-like protein CG13603 [Tubulanus polymorphus]|uniref:putative OPA3-like protein CG13603 n=1 Tax=Tubulanus polymorphus TaxID=672921 RepID=UPI003DA3BE68